MTTVLSRRPVLQVLSPLVATLETADGDLVHAVTEALSYYPRGFSRDYRFTMGSWDGRVCLARYAGGMLEFPTGLVERVARVVQDCLGTEAAKALDEEAWNDLGAFAAHLPTPLPHTWSDAPGPLRDYQEAAVQAAVLAGRGVVEMPTGTGKTHCVAAIIARLGHPALVIVPTKDLLYQTAKVLQARMPRAEIRVVGDGHHDFSRDITVGLFPTLSRRLEEFADDLRRIGVVVSDEGHHAGSAATWRAVLDACPAPYRFAVSATPYTNTRQTARVPVGRGRVVMRTVEVGHDLVLEATTGPLVYRYTDAEATAAGWLIPPHIWLVALTAGQIVQSDDPTRPDFATAWNDIYRRGVVEHAERNARLLEIAALATANYGKTLILVSALDHGVWFGEALRARGVKTAFLSGAATSAERARALAGFRGMKYDALVATSLFDEGVDVPAIAAVVFAGGGKADHKTIQRIGRGRRPGGADRLLVIDVLDDAHPILAGHAKKRRTLYRSRGWAWEVV